MRRQSCGATFTASGTIISSTTGRCSGSRGCRRSRGGDAAVERRGASAATGSGDFPGASKPCSMSNSCSRSTFSLCAPKSRRISASTFSRSSLFSVRNSASSSLTRAFSAVARASFSLSSFSRGVSLGIARVRQPRRSNVHLFLRRCANTLTPSRPRPFIRAHTTAASLPRADRSRRSASPAPPVPALASPPAHPRPSATRRFPAPAA